MNESLTFVCQWTDSSNNKVAVYATGDKSHYVMFIVGASRLMGYVTDAKWGETDYGPIIAWFGTDQKYATWQQVIQASK